VADGSRGLGQAAIQALMQVRSRFCLIRTDNHLGRLTHGGFSMQGETAEALRQIGEALRVAPANGTSPAAFPPAPRLPGGAPGSFLGDNTSANRTRFSSMHFI
jgi:hypothetical protein